uniref:uncharacterized protein n=1 Tax=Lonchura striata TaxID=40157 RepID=UPI00129337C4|nr:uncharacterized protein LOC116183585 [Lonchura striata domestica]
MASPSDAGGRELAAFSVSCLTASGVLGEPAPFLVVGVGTAEFSAPQEGQAEDSKLNHSWRQSWVWSCPALDPARGGGGGLGWAGLGVQGKALLPFGKAPAASVPLGWDPLVWQPQPLSGCPAASLGAAGRPEELWALGRGRGTPQVGTNTSHGSQGPSLAPRHTKIPFLALCPCRDGCWCSPRKCQCLYGSHSPSFPPLPPLSCLTASLSPLCLSQLCLLLLQKPQCSALEFKKLLSELSRLCQVCSPASNRCFHISCSSNPCSLISHPSNPCSVPSSPIPAIPVLFPHLPSLQSLFCSSNPCSVPSSSVPNNPCPVPSSPVPAIPVLFPHLPFQQSLFPPFLPFQQ